MARGTGTAKLSWRGVGTGEINTSVRSDASISLPIVRVRKVGARMEKLAIPQQLSLFSVDRLPHKPYCTDDYETGNWPRTLTHAIKRRYIQPNPPAVRFRLVFDVDRPAGALAWSDSNLAPPNWAATNPKNGHAHVGYEIDIPITVDPLVERAPVRFAAAIECAYRESMSADASYSGHLCKNPLHEHWITQVFRDDGYSLHELSEYVDLNRFSDKRKKLPEYGLGRNVALFNKLRLWAYKAINAYRPAGDFEAWHELVRDKAAAYNDFASALPANEVQHTAKSVATWVWQIAPASAVQFSRKQAERGARRHEKFKEEHGIVAYEKAQSQAALASAATKRERTRGKIIQAIGELTAKGESVTMRAVARLAGVSAPTLSQHYRDLFPDLGR